MAPGAPVESQLSVLRSFYRTAAAHQQATYLGIQTAENLLHAGTLDLLGPRLRTTM